MIKQLAVKLSNEAFLKKKNNEKFASDLKETITISLTGNEKRQLGVFDTQQLY